MPTVVVLPTVVVPSLAPAPLDCARAPTCAELRRSRAGGHAAVATIGGWLPFGQVDALQGVTLFA